MSSANKRPKLKTYLKRANTALSNGTLNITKVLLTAENEAAKDGIFIYALDVTASFKITIFIYIYISLPDLRWYWNPRNSVEQNYPSKINMFNVFIIVSNHFHSIIQTQELFKMGLDIVELHLSTEIGTFEVGDACAKN